MPTYSYECANCGHVFDVFHAMSASPRPACESCGARRCKKMIGTGAGIIFKGSGFYETDYKDKKGTPPKEGKTKAKSDSSGEKAKSDSKPAPSKESKPAKKAAAKAN